jgi:outer membrane receptor protein involved in Fe transport
MTQQQPRCSANAAALSFACLSLGFTFGACVNASEPTLSPSDDRKLEEVVVTGSRIPVGVAGATTPITVIDKKAIERGGQDSLGRVLQALPFSTTAMNTNVNNGGDGSERLDLRGLGSNRTILLLNGRRLPNGGLGGDGSVDLGMIPLSVVERIEVQTSGASAIYGADAVAGVVNVITRKAVPGFEINVKNTLTEKGDGRITVGQLTGGREIAGGDWMFGGEFVQQKPVSMDARAYSAVPMQFISPDLTLGFAGSGNAPDGRYLVPAGNAFGLAPGPYYRIPGSRGQSASNYLSFDPNNPDPASLFNFAPYNYLQTPNRRDAIWLLGSQPVADDVTLFAEGLWYARKSSQHLAPTPYSLNPDPGPVLADGSIGVPADNWYNPFGVDVTRIRRRFIELPQREFQQDIQGWRALIGMRGAWRSWQWDVALADSRSTSTSINTGLPSAVRLVPAIGPSGPDATGQIVCGARDASGIVPLANIVAGCVPVNLFGGAGSITREQADYLAVALTDHGDNAQRLLSFNTQGPFGKLPAGPVQWSFGAEYRRESGGLTFDPLGRAGVISVTAQSDIVHASFDARELYMETRAPLLKELPGAKLLDIVVGLRYSRFSSFGTDSTWQTGINWKPVASWSMRASYAQVFRVPNLQELYSAQVKQRVQESDDPCGNGPTAAQQVNCAANGVPGGAYQEDALDEWDILTGGNSRLAPERGTSFDAGIDLQPVSWPQVRVTVDFFNVDLHGFIEDPTVSDVLLECANRGTPAVCALIHRAPDGTLQQIDTVSSNFGRAVSSGYDFGASLAFDARQMHISAGMSGTYLARRNTQAYIGGATTRGAGRFVDFSLAFPHWRGNAYLEASRPTWHVSYSLQFIGSYTGCGDGNQYLADTDCYEVAPRLYHDVEGSVIVTGGLELRAGITNLTNAMPPFVDTANGNTTVATYRLLGRSYFAGVRYRFR